MAIYFRPLILTAGRNKSAYFSRRDDSKLTSNRTLSQLYVDRDSAERAIHRYSRAHPHDVVYSEIEEVDGSRESNPVRKPTIYEALRTKLGREPTRAELKEDVERIKREALQELAAKGKLRHQRKRNPVKKRANDLTPQAIEGYNGEPLKYLYSSPSWYAYKIGEHFRLSGRPEPSDVRMGRGYSINVRDMTFSFGKNDAVTRVK